MADEESGASEMGQKFYGFGEDTSSIEIPERLPVLPLRGVVIFPSAIVPLPISRKPSLQLVEQCLAREDKILGLVAQKTADEERPDPADLFTRGTAGRLLKMLRYPDHSVRILVQGLRRIEIDAYEEGEPYYISPRAPADRRVRGHQGPGGDPGTPGEPVRGVHLDDPVPAR